MDKAVLERLQALCARREYCYSDILRKAAARTEGDTTAARELADALARDGFVSDARYASAFAREKAGIQGWGPIKIRHALRIKEIERETIEAALAEIDEGKALEKLEKLIRIKAHSLEGDPQARLKLIRYALSRGYDYGDVEKVLRNLRSE